MATAKIRWMDVKDISLVLDMSPDDVAKMCKKGIIKATMRGGRKKWFIKEKDFRAYFEKTFGQ